MAQFRGNKLLSLLILTFVVMLGVAQAQKAAPANAKPTADASQYVGSDTCKGCHEEVFNQFAKTPHFQTTTDKHRDAAHQGCEACHGPGAEHVNGGGDKAKIFTFKDVNAKEISARCMQCHEYGSKDSSFLRTAHNRGDVSCIDCHSTHKPAQRQFLLSKAQPNLCYSCHNEIQPDFSKPFHHKVNEGLVQCTDCHNQHGGQANHQLRATAKQDAVCFKCHTDKAGPFVYEHEVVKTEGCEACHVPHGSANPRLLKQTQINLLCSECHTASQTAAGIGLHTMHNQSTKYTACIMCHSNVHGSNASNLLFK